MLMQLFGSDGRSHVKTRTHAHARGYIPDTQSNISVNETGGPLLHRLHTALSVTVTAGEERAKKQRVNKIVKEEKKRRKKKEKDGSKRGRGGQRSGGYCSLPLLFPPLQKTATSIKSLMIPALCHGSAGERERDRKCLSGREPGSDAEQR